MQTYFCPSNSCCHHSRKLVIIRWRLVWVRAYGPTAVSPIACSFAMFPITQGWPLCHLQNWVKTHCLAINALRTGKGLFSNAVLWLWILVVSSTLLLCSWPEDAIKKGGEPIPACTLKSWGWSRRQPTCMGAHRILCLTPLATNGCWCSVSFVRMSIWKTVLEGLRALLGSCDGCGSTYWKWRCPSVCQQC